MGDHAAAILCGLSGRAGAGVRALLLCRHAEAEGTDRPRPAAGVVPAAASATKTFGGTDHDDYPTPSAYDQPASQSARTRHAAGLLPDRRDQRPAASSSSPARPRSIATAMSSARMILPHKPTQVFHNLSDRPAGARMHARQSGEADRVPDRHGQSRTLSRGTKPLLRDRDAAGRARRDAGRGIEALWAGFPDRDRGDRAA